MVIPIYERSGEQDNLTRQPTYVSCPKVPPLYVPVTSNWIKHQPHERIFQGGSAEPTMKYLRDIANDFLNNKIGVVLGDTGIIER